MGDRWILYPPFAADAWPPLSAEAIRDAESRLDALRTAIARSKAPAFAENAELRAAQAELARARGEEYAVPVSLAVQMDSGAPEPLLLASAGFVGVVYRGPLAPDGPFTEAPPQEVCGVLRFQGGAEVLTDGPNDEALQKHRLYGHGLSWYDAFEVGNSRWAAVSWNKRLPVGEQAAAGERRKHFVVTFHDGMIEVLARSMHSSSVLGSHGGAFGE